MHCARYAMRTSTRSHGEWKTLRGNRATFLADEKRRAEEVARALDATLLGAGLAIPPRLTTLVRTHQKKVEQAITTEQRGASSATHAKVVSTTETMVLVIDGIVRGLAHKDARAASKALADVADDLAQGLSDERAARDLDRAKMRTAAAKHVLAGGQKQLARLGMLGRDLSGAVRAGLSRVDRASPGDLQHAELAARDLAERLREADPSFGSRGGTGGHATGESGGESSSSGEEGDASDAERAFNEAAQDLEQLDQDHGGEVGRAEQALSRPLGDEDMKQMKDAAKPHAAAVREAVKDFPSRGGGSDTWSSKGAAAREHAEQMARSLESGAPGDAVTSGRQAIDAIDEAKRIAARERYTNWEDQTAAGADTKLDEAKKKLEPEIKWAEEQLAQMKKKAAERASGDFEEERRSGARARGARAQARGEESLARCASGSSARIAGGRGARGARSRERARARRGGARDGEATRCAARARPSEASARRSAARRRRARKQKRRRRSLHELRRHGHPLAGRAQRTRRISEARAARIGRALGEQEQRRDPSLRGGTPAMTKRALVVFAMAAAVLARDAGAQAVRSADAVKAHDLTIGLDLPAARAVLAKADAQNTEIALERARIALYDGDCDGAASILADPAVAKLDEDEYAGHYDAGLGDIARGCARATAATVLEEDKTKNVWVRFQDDEDRAMMPIVVDTIVKARDALTRDLGVDWPTPTRVVIVRDLHALSAMTGLPYESASTTGTVGIAKWGRVTLLSPRASHHGYAWRDTLAHELTHLAVTHASGDRAPLWLQEGIAKREELRWRAPAPFDDRPSPESVIAWGMQKKLDLPLDKLGASIAMLPSAEQAMVAFAEVTSFVRYMATQAGDESVKKLLAALRARAPIDTALATATGADLKGWDGRWRAHLATLGTAPAPDLAEAKEGPDTTKSRERVRLAELLIGRSHERDAVTELDQIGGAFLREPHVRYLKARALEKDPSADAEKVLGEPAELSASYAPWWAIRGRLTGTASYFEEAIAQDPFDVEAACESLDGSKKAGDPLCEAARRSGTPDVGHD